MDIEIVEQFVRSLVVALMNGVLYFPRHRRVVEAVGEAVRVLEGYFKGKPALVLGIWEGLLIFEGRPQYDLSIYAHRLIRAVQEQGGHGLRFSQGVTAEEMVCLVEVLLGPAIGTVGEAKALLRQKGVSYVDLEERLPAESLERKIRNTAGAVQTLLDHKVSRDAYTGALDALQNVMVGLRRSGEVSFMPVNEMAERLAHAMQANRERLLALTAIKDYDAYTFNHSVNVCIYTTALAQSMDAPADELVSIAQAALLHDVGKLLIPEEILYKPGRLSGPEEQIMRQHPLLGAKILTEAEGVHELAVNAAFGHHLRYDRRGYPGCSREIPLDPVTEYINTIDVYEALTAKRPYKKPFSPEEAADILLRGAGSEFNPKCVVTFFRFFGVYPSGTPVRLKDGTKGRVASANPGDPFHPMVCLTHSAEGEPVESEEIVDTGKRNSRGEYHRSIVGSIF